MKLPSPNKLVSIILLLPLATVLGAFAINCAEVEKTDGKISAVTSILPLATFVEKIGGERVEVSVMVPPGASPHTHEPTPSQMTGLARARMYTKVGSGIEFELAWMEQLIAVNREMLVVDCSTGISLRENVTQREYGTMDPHIWLSPQNAKIMVLNIYTGLVQVDPGNKAYYQENLDSYLQKLTKLDQDIKQKLSKLNNRRFIIYHSAFGYFAEEYDLSIMSIEEGGKEPTVAGITQVIEQAKEHNIKVIFTSPQFNPQSAEVIAREIDGRVVFIDSLAKDYIANMRKFTDELIKAAE